MTELANGASWAAATGLFLWLVRTVYNSYRSRNTVTRAILTEIKMVNRAMEKRLAWFRDPKRVDPKKSVPPLMPFSVTVLSHLVKEIGRLESDLAGIIVDWNGYVQFINDYQRSRKEHARRGEDDKFRSVYPQILEQHLAQRGNTAFERWFRKYRVT